MKRLIVSLAVLTLTTTVVASTLTILPLKKAGWTTISNTGPLPLIQTPTTLGFEFPQVGVNTANYLYTSKPLPKMAFTPAFLRVSMVVTANGPVVFDFHNPADPDNICDGPPASVRPFIMAKNIYGNPDWASASGRWWSATSYTLAPGATTLTTDFNSAFWSNVNGIHGNYDDATWSEFNYAINHLAAVGVTFGGGCFFSHGVGVSGGTATFSLQDYRLE